MWARFLPKMSVKECEEIILIISDKKEIFLSSQLISVYFKEHNSTVWLICVFATPIYYIHISILYSVTNQYLKKFSYGFWDNQWFGRNQIYLKLKLGATQFMPGIKNLNMIFFWFFFEFQTKKFHKNNVKNFKKLIIFKKLKINFLLINF
jgi:hypothetical protein